MLYDSKTLQTIMYYFVFSIYEYRQNISKSL